MQETTTMVIEPNNNVNTQRAGDSQGQSSRPVANNQVQLPPTADKAAAPTKEDTVVLSSQAKNLKALEEKVSKQSPVDNDKVDKIKAAIERGEYPINYDKVAEKLLEYEELFMK